MDYWPKEHEKNATVPVVLAPFEIGHNVCITKTTQDLTNPSVLAGLKYFKITNRKIIKSDTRSVASADLPAAAASVELSAKTNWVDWLESSDDTLYQLLMGFLSDHYTEWEVRYPQSEQSGTIKKSPGNRWTQDDSPFWNPRLLAYSWEEEFPVFKLYNQSQYTLKFALVRALGYKYSMVELGRAAYPQWPPAPVHYIVLEDVTTA